MLALLFLFSAVGASAEPQQDACLSITTRIEAAGPLEEPQRTSAAYMLCLKQRPRATFLGVTSAVQDCREFAHAYQLAKQFGKASFSAAELCATLHLYAGDAARLSAGVAEVTERKKKSNVLDQTIDRAACETHMRKIEQLRLDQQEAAGIVQADCPKRFKAQLNSCMQAGKLFAAGNLAGACELLVPHRRPSVDMVAVCKRVATKVDAVGLEGEVLRRAATDLCVRELKSLAPQASQQRTLVGCNFFAKRLEAVQQQGRIDAPHFCITLGGGRQEAVATAKVAVPAAPESPVALQPQPRPSTAARTKTGGVTALQTLMGAEGTEGAQIAEAAEAARSAAGSGGGDASVVDQGTAVEQQQRLQQQQQQLLPAEVGGATAELDAKFSRETQASNDFLTGFLENYEDTSGRTAPPSTAAPPAPTQHMAAESTNTDQKPAKTPVLAAPAQGTMDTLPGAQPDAGQELTQVAGSFSALSPPDGLLPGVSGEMAPVVAPPRPVLQPAAPPPDAPTRVQDAARDNGDDFDGAVASFLDNTQ